MIKIVFHGEPKGKGRPRFVSTPRGGRAYTPAETVSYERMIAWLAKQQGAMPIEGPMRLIVRAYLGIPQSTSKKRRADMLAGIEHPTKKPDADNLIKAVCDGLNGIAFKDDAQVVEIVMVKRWSDEPRLEIEVSPVAQAQQVAA